MDQPVPVPASTAMDHFVRTVLRSGLLNRDELNAVIRALSSEFCSDPTALADRLVQTGQLSRFQARKLLQGRSRGLLLEHFQILAPIGKGGMSTVYLARDSRSSVLVALKVLPPKKA